MKHFLTVLLLAIIFTSCSSMVAVPKRTQNGSVKNYTYAYIMPTNTITSTSTSGSVINGYGYVGGSSSSINPMDVISGYLMKEGYTVIPNLNTDLLDRTMVVTFGYLGRRSLGPFAYATIILLQFRDAKTHELIESCEAEGCGEDEAQDYLQAIKAAMDAIFHP